MKSCSRTRLVLQYELRPAGRPRFLGSLQQRKRKRSATRWTEPVHYLAWARNGTHPAAAPVSADCPAELVTWHGVRGAELKRDRAGERGQSVVFRFFCVGTVASLLCDAPWWPNPVACRCRRLSGPGGSCSSPCRWSRWASPSRWPGCSWSGGSPSAHHQTTTTTLTLFLIQIPPFFLFFLKKKNKKNFFTCCRVKPVNIKAKQ